jgi:hypothetical protein
MLNSQQLRNPWQKSTQKEWKVYQVSLELQKNPRNNIWNELHACSVCYYVQYIKVDTSYGAQTQVLCGVFKLYGVHVANIKALN